MSKSIFIVFALLLPTVAYANMVWPALYLEVHLFSWWAISAGLLIEYVFVRKLLCADTKQAMLATVVANVVSAALGIVLIPLAGIAWEVIAGLLLYNLLNMGSFNPITWFATFMLACAVNVAVEGLVYKKAFKLGFFYKSKLFFLFMAANAASVGVAMVSLIVNPE